MLDVWEKFQSEAPGRQGARQGPLEQQGCFWSRERCLGGGVVRGGRSNLRGEPGRTRRFVPCGIGVIDTSGFCLRHWLRLFVVALAGRAVLSLASAAVEECHRRARIA